MKLSAIALFVLLIPSLAPASDTTKFSPEGLRAPKAINLTLPAKRTTFLVGDIREAMTGKFITEHRLLAQTSGDIYAVINSNGGSVEAGLAVINEIVAAKQLRKVNTICVIESKAYSMAAVIASFCHKTFIHEDAKMLFHNMSFNAEGVVPEVVKYVLFVNHFNDIITAKVAAQLGIPADVYRQLIRDELWIMSDDAVRFGFVDGAVHALTYTEPPKEADDLFDRLMRQEVPYVTLLPGSDPLTPEMYDGIIARCKELCAPRDLVSVRVKYTAAKQHVDVHFACGK